MINPKQHMEHGDWKDLKSPVREHTQPKRAAGRVILVLIATVVGVLLVAAGLTAVGIGLTAFFVLLAGGAR